MCLKRTLLKANSLVILFMFLNCFPENWQFTHLYDYSKHLPQYSLLHYTHSFIGSMTMFLHTAHLMMSLRSSPKQRSLSSICKECFGWFSLFCKVFSHIWNPSDFTSIMLSSSYSWLCPKFIAMNLSYSPREYPIFNVLSFLGKLGYRWSSSLIL